MDLFLRINSFLRLVLLLIGFFVLQISIIPVSASPVIFGQDYHICISEIYTYDEIENSVRAEVSPTVGLSRVLSKEKVGSGLELYQHLAEEEEVNNFKF